MIEGLLALNALLSCGVLTYCVRVEHRFTALETRVDIMMRALGLSR